MANKWVKWQVGILATLGTVALFQVIKASPEYVQALEANQVSQDATAQQQPREQPLFENDGHRRHGNHDDAAQWVEQDPGTMQQPRMNAQSARS